MFRSVLRPSRLVLHSRGSGILSKARCTSTLTETAVPGIPTKTLLRHYQEECIQAVLTHLAKGYKRLGISLATGSGKTVIFTHLIDRVKSLQSQANQTLILVHRRELVEQAARHCLAVYPTKTLDIEAGKHHASGAADITVASVQSLRSPDRLQKFQPDRFKLVLVDEAHHIVAPGYLKVLEHFGLRHPSPQSPALVGVSATLSRFDGIRLGEALDYIVYHKDYVDMIDESWLASVVYTVVKTHADLSKVRTSSMGDFVPAALSEAVNTPALNEITVRSWLARANGRRATIVFCVDIAHVRDLTAAFQRHGIDARYVTGEDRARDRDQRLAAFKAGEYPVILNCGVFTEGTDIPNVDCVLLARPTRSRNLLVQMIGRGLRLHPDKENCLIIDMVSALSTGIVTTPTLFGLDPAALAQDDSVKDLKKLKQQRDQAIDNKSDGNVNEASATVEPSKKVTFTDYDNIHDLIEDTSGERHIKALSRLAWVQIDDGKYRVIHTDKSYVALDREDIKSSQERLSPERRSDELYCIRFVERLPETSLSKKNKFRAFKRARLVGEKMTFTDAVHAADKLVESKFPRSIILRNAPWRGSEATEGQLAFINKQRDPSEQLSPADVTKGAAMDMITRIVFGARGRFKKIKAIAARDRKVIEKTQERAAHEEVRVGPVRHQEATASV